MDSTDGRQVGPPGSIFAEDERYRDVDDMTLRITVGDASRSVVERGRALLEIGRRARHQPQLRDALLTWINDPAMASARWMGQVTLAWIAACCLGYAAPDNGTRASLAEALARWSAGERESLLAWAQHETWFEGIS